MSYIHSFTAILYMDIGFSAPISLDHSNGTVEASSFVTRRVLAEIVYVIYYEVWAVFMLEYKL